MLNPYKKGKVGELALVHILKKHFPQFKESIHRISGTEKSRASITGDVACLNQKCILSRFHFDNKNRENLNIFEALAKAKDDGQGKVPLLRWQRTYKEPLFIIKEIDLINLLIELQGYVDENENSGS